MERKLFEEKTLSALNKNTKRVKIKYDIKFLKICNFIREGRLS